MVDVEVEDAESPLKVELYQRIKRKVREGPATMFFF